MSTEIPLHLLVKRLTPNAQAPTRGSAYAAGYDLYSVEDTVVPARSQALISTGLAMTIPEGYYGRIAPRSGLAVKHGISVGAGVIDSDYTSMVKVLLINTFDTDLHVSEGDRIAQLIIEKIATPEVQMVENLPATVRGAGGFGSTGK